MRFVLSNDTLFLLCILLYIKMSLVQRRNRHIQLVPVRNGDRMTTTISDGPLKQRWSDFTHACGSGCGGPGGLCTLQSDSLLIPPRPMAIALAQVGCRYYYQRVIAFTPGRERVNFIGRKVGALMVYIKTTKRNISRAADFRVDSYGEFSPSW